MSNLETHEAEQAEIIAKCEAGECHHPKCHQGCRGAGHHDDLVAALSGLLDQIEQLVGMFHGDEALEAAILDAEAALADARNHGWRRQE